MGTVSTDTFHYGREVPARMRDSQLVSISKELKAEFHSSALGDVSPIIIFSGTGRDQTICFRGTAPSDKRSDLVASIEHAQAQYPGQITAPAIQGVGALDGNAMKSAGYVMVAPSVVDMM